VTPRAQPGNPKPRLFRLPQQEAIINRMGFNNSGVDHLLERVRRATFEGPIGINIGKNFDTPVEHATEDYLAALRKVYAVASYVTINVSSPNTPGLRSLQFGDALKQLLEAIKREQDVLAGAHGRQVPVAMKIAPDLADDELVLVASAVLEHGIDGVVATNTTLARDAVLGALHAQEAGGLSGRPLTRRSTEVIAALHAELGQKVPIIGVGGIFSGLDALDKIRAGASLVQLYSGFIYRGPRLIGEVVETLRQEFASNKKPAVAGSSG
jgi:dihydroorotate dehydrogenase